MATTGSLADMLAGTEGVLRPPPRLSLSEWADRHFYLSAESAAEPGRWRTLPYQRGIMDAITSPAVERVSWMKSARVGATKIMNATIGYYMHQDPCPIMVVQPTVEDAQGYSKEEIAPMLRDCPELSRVIGEPTTKSSSSTILAKTFPGGSLTMVGANSGRGFRRVSRRVVIFDEVDGYPPSAGSEGDQIALGIRRTEFYANRKIIAASTPLVAGASRIEQMFNDGDQRHYHVPCTQCGHMDTLVFNRKAGGRGHWMSWPEGQPQDAHFVCSSGHGCVIDGKDKRRMLDGGRWIADSEFTGHASFHIWAAYSLSPNATWGQLATEFVEASRQGPDKLKTVVNTVLGETWQERGEAPDWERLYQRREAYPIGTVPDGAVALTAGVDVQKDRFVYEVVAWSATKESWSVDSGILMGDTADEASWARLDELVARNFPGSEGRSWPISLLAVDAGYNTQQVYNWARRYPMSRVIACKGVSTARTLIGTPSAVDVTARGKRHQRGYKVWPIGVDIAKGELYGFLRLPLPLDGEDARPGYCHFPEYDDEYFKQITAEQLVSVRKKNGYTEHAWQMLPGRENHWLDCRVYARAAASVLGLDRVAPPRPAAVPAARKAPSPAPDRVDSEPRRPPGGGKQVWLGPGGVRRGKRRGWLSGR